MHARTCLGVRVAYAQFTGQYRLIPDITPALHSRTHMPPACYNLNLVRLPSHCQTEPTLSINCHRAPHTSHATQLNLCTTPLTGCLTDTGDHINMAVAPVWFKGKSKPHWSATQINGTHHTPAPSQNQSHNGERTNLAENYQRHAGWHVSANYATIQLQHDHG